MRIISVHAINFGSYKELNFDFTDTGPTLVHGATGSGKSTLQDLVPWVLFGTTAKDGNVDEVKSWNAEHATIGTISIEYIADTIHVTRVRGTSKQNDLFWTWDTNPNLDVCRGKDLADSQRLLNELLGVDADTYTTATTFNEFSEAGLFFLSKAKDRRSVFEKITNLEFAATIANLTAAARKTNKKLLGAAYEAFIKQNERHVQAQAQLDSVTRYHINWRTTLDTQIQKLEVQYKHFEKEKSSTIEALETKSYRFETDKEKKINDLVDKLDALGQLNDASRPIKEDRLAKAQAALPRHCDKCGRANNTSDAIEKLKAEIEKCNLTDKQFSDYGTKLRDVQAQVNPYKDQCISAKKLKNHYGEQLEAKKREVNPFSEQLAQASAALPKIAAELDEKTSITTDLQKKQSALDQLHDLSYTLRGVMLRNAAKAVQNSTNQHLSQYFDSEFSVLFELKDDNLQVDINKNGNPCVYKQLSKGQRQMLKLCFAVSVMKAAANNSGVSFNVLMFDEALSGLDSNLKLKAYKLFEDLSLSHESVLVIEHDPEFQSLFSNKYKVTLVNDESHIEHA